MKYSEGNSHVIVGF